MTERPPSPPWESAGRTRRKPEKASSSDVQGNLKRDLSKIGKKDGKKPENGTASGDKNLQKDRMEKRNTKESTQAGRKFPNGGTKERVSSKVGAKAQQEQKQKGKEPLTSNKQKGGEKPSSSKQDPGSFGKVVGAFVPEVGSSLHFPPLGQASTQGTRNKTHSSSPASSSTNRATETKTLEANEINTSRDNRENGTSTSGQIAEAHVHTSTAGNIGHVQRGQKISGQGAGSSGNVGRCDVARKQGTVGAWGGTRPQGYSMAAAMPAAPKPQSAPASRAQPVTEKVAPKKPKIGQPIQFSLGDLIITTNRKKKQQRRLIASRPTQRVGLKHGQGHRTGGNMLDSTAPLVRRGKERENPKPKRPTKLKSVIKKAREMRKALREKSSTEPTTAAVNHEGGDEEKTVTDEGGGGWNDETGVEDCGWVSADEVEGKREKGEGTSEARRANVEEGGGGDAEVGVAHQKKEKVGEKVEEGKSVPVKENKANKNTTKQTTATSSTPISSHQQSSGGEVRDLASERVTDYDYFRGGAKTVVGSCRYENIPALHTRKFRGYCTHLPSEALDKLSKSLIKDLVTFQQRKMQINPIKAQARRRYFKGINEVAKAVGQRQIKCLLVATDMEDVGLEGGLNERLREILATCNARGITVVYTLNRRAMGFAMGTKVPQSLFAIADYSGAHETYQQMIGLVDSLSRDYLNRIGQHRPTCDLRCNMVPDTTERRWGSTVAVGPQRTHMEVFEGLAGDTLDYHFTTEQMDIKFAITADDGTEIVTGRRVACHERPEEGHITLSKAGKYTILWDNGYSVHNSKSLTYSLVHKFSSAVPQQQPLSTTSVPAGNSQDITISPPTNADNVGTQQIQTPPKVEAKELNTTEEKETPLNVQKEVADEKVDGEGRVENGVGDSTEGSAKKKTRRGGKKQKKRQANTTVAPQGDAAGGNGEEAQTHQQSDVRPVLAATSSGAMVPQLTLANGHGHGPEVTQHERATGVQHVAKGRHGSRRMPKQNQQHKHEMHAGYTRDLTPGYYDPSGMYVGSDGFVASHGYANANYNGYVGNEGNWSQGSNPAGVLYGGMVWYPPPQGYGQ